jgi:uncharacterized protein with PQ loop repeat
MANQHHLLKYLHKKRNRTKIDAAMSVAAVAHPLMALPQVWLIYSTHQVEGLSLFMWVAWLALGLVFLTYGLAHLLKPYILMQVLWVIVDLLVITGILLYR